MTKNKKIKAKFFQHYVDLYYQMFIISFNQTDEQVLKEMIKRKFIDSEDTDLITSVRESLEDVNGTSAARTIKYAGGLILLRFNQIDPTDPLTYGHIAHEVYHATTATLRRRGLLDGEETEEAYAYMIGHLTEVIVKRLI